VRKIQDGQKQNEFILSELLREPDFQKEMISEFPDENRSKSVPLTKAKLSLSLPRRVKPNQTEIQTEKEPVLHLDQEPTSIETNQKERPEIIIIIDDNEPGTNGRIIFSDSEDFDQPQEREIEDFDRYFVPSTLKRPRSTDSEEPPPKRAKENDQDDIDLL